MMLRFNRVLSSPLIHSRMRVQFTPSITQKFTSSTKKFATQQHNIQLSLAFLTNQQQRFFSSQSNENNTKTSNTENTQNNENETNKQEGKEEDFEAPVFERKTNKNEEEQQQTKSEGGKEREQGEGGKKKEAFFKGYFKRFLKGDMGILVPTFVTPAVLLGMWLIVSKTYDLDRATVLHALQEMFLEAPRKYFSMLFSNLMNWAEPSRRPLLPPIVPEYGRKYTLVIDMETLCDYYKDNGVWYLYKRAGLDYFLTSLFRQYEVILYTKEPPGSNQQAIFKLDPTNFYFSTIKYREMMGIKDSHGYFTDDWEMLRREPDKVIFLDTGKKKYEHTNTIFIGGAEEGTADTVLIDLVPILKEVEKTGGDLREIVLQLQTDNPKERIRSWRDHYVLGKPAPAKIVRREKPPPSDVSGGSIVDQMLDVFQRIRATKAEEEKEQKKEDEDEEEEKEDKKDNTKKRIQQRK